MEKPRKRTNPSGKVVWRARVIDQRTGRRREIGTAPTRREAEAMQLDYIQRHALGLEEMTLGRYFELWQVRHPRPSDRTNRSNRQRIRNYVVPVLGDLAVHELRRRHVLRLRDQLIAQGLGARMTRGVLASLSSMLSNAVEDDVAELNPALRVKVAATDPRITARPPRRKRILSYDQMLALAAKAPHPYGGAVLFAGATGARPAEIFGRMYRDLDRERMRVRIDSTAYEGRIEAGTKTDHGEDSAGRWSILTPELIAYIDAAPRSVTGLLWPTPRGRVWHASNFYRDVFVPTRKAAKMEGVTIYDLRHSWVSLMQEAGVPIGDLALASGHSRISTLQDTYTHALGRSEEQMRAVLRRTA
jgi:integrase